MTQPIYGIPPDHVVHRDLAVIQGATPWTRPESVMRPIWDAGIDGGGCIGIVLDTGFKSHSALPAPLAGRNFTTSNTSDITDRNGHGTHCCGSVVGRQGIGGAPGAAIKVGKVLGDNGSGSNTIAGLNWAAEQDGDVVSCSWGGGSSVDSGTEAALKRIEASGKWLVFAAGNAGYNGRNSVISPALSSHNLAVSSINSDWTLSGFSSGGPAVDIAAGGGGIISCGLNNNLVMMSGTSMATPTSAGDLLLLRQVMKRLGMVTFLTSRGLVEFLKSEQFLVDAGPAGDDPMYGKGIITSRNILTWISKKATEWA